jgi:hypothetical protein
LASALLAPAESLTAETPSVAEKNPAKSDSSPVYLRVPCG